MLNGTVRDFLTAKQTNLIGEQLTKQAFDAVQSLSSDLQRLLSNRQMPETGWSDLEIEVCLHELSCLDSNNFKNSSGCGEREGRVYSDLVRRRHYYMSHGVGRSGNLTEVQPKAAGSSVLARLAQILALDALRVAGLVSVQRCIVVPMATGMTLALCIATLRQQRPAARFVLMPRIDQKSCLKCAQLVACELVVVPNRLVGDQLCTDVEGLEGAVKQLGASNVVCVMTTTACFAPRGCDDVTAVARLCRAADIPHLVNNAYGVQVAAVAAALERAGRVRVDLVVQSTDKNFLVPVGGSVVAAFDKRAVDAVSAAYAGRASAAPALDLFVTLLSMGRAGFAALLEQRASLFEYLREQMSAVAARLGQRILDTPDNGISVAMTLDGLGSPTEVGSRLFARRVSGARVVAGREAKTVAGVTLTGFGAHHDTYPHAYLTFAASIGATRADVDRAIAKLADVLSQLAPAPVR